MGKPHPRNALAAVNLSKLAPGKHSDGLGLYLVVDDSGARRWMLRAVLNGRRQELGLGGFPTVSLAAARAETLHLRAIARQGGDPRAERNANKRSIPTFEKAATEVHNAHSKSWRNPKHRQQWINTITQYVPKDLRDRRVDQWGTSEVLKVLLPMWTTKCETARRVKQRIKVVLDWAKAKEYRTGDNPAEAISQVLPKQPEAKEHHAAMPYAQVPGFIINLHQAEAERSSKLAFEFLILTATRTNETLQAKWAEIDFEAQNWTIPATRTKSKRPHVVPLPTRCMAILRELNPTGKAAGYIFPGRTPSKPLSQMVFLMLLRRMAVDVTAHGFRSSFRDWASERTNFSREVCETALAHVVKDKTEAAYNRTKLIEKRRELMQRWSDFVAERKGQVISIAKQA